MGASFSDFSSHINDCCSSSSSFPTSLNDLPENCVSSILSYLDPPEICKLAALNRTFHGASLSDLVWESKLPENYKFLVEKLLQENPLGLTKKEVFSRLCQPNYFDDETKQIWMDKRSGKICVSISYKAMRITGIDDRRYWNHIPSEESRFKTIAYLQQIWWFEVKGEIEMEFSPDTYCLVFKLQLGKPYKRYGKTSYNVDQVHGWNIKPVRFQLSTSNGQHASSEHYFQEHGKWIYYNVGKFTVDRSSSKAKIQFSMTQIDCTHTKGGVCFDSVFICPFDSRDEFLKF